MGVGWLSTVPGLKWKRLTVSRTRASQKGLKDLVTWMFCGWPLSSTVRYKPTSASWGTSWLG